MNLVNDQPYTTSEAADDLLYSTSTSTTTTTTQAPSSGQHVKTYQAYSGSLQVWSLASLILFSRYGYFPDLNLITYLLYWFLDANKTRAAGTRTWWILLQAFGRASLPTRWREQPTQQQWQLEWWQLGQREHPTTATPGTACYRRQTPASSHSTNL